MVANPANPISIPGNIKKGRRVCIFFVRKVAAIRDKSPVNWIRAMIQPVCASDISCTSWYRVGSQAKQAVSRARGPASPMIRSIVLRSFERLSSCL